MRSLFVALILAIHGALLAWISYVHAPMFDEIAHLGAGISHWRLGTFELYRVNPPLPRMLGTVPVILANPKTDWSEVSSEPFARSEFDVGIRITELNGSRAVGLFRLARWACIPFSLLGGWICYRWAADLFGFASGLAALVMWCFCPNILAWGGTFTPDVAAGALGATAGYGFWRWLQEPNWKTTILSAVTLGLAELAKTTWIVLFLVLPGVWLATRMIRRPPDGESSRRREAGQLAAVLLTALYLINLGYGFENSFRALGDFRFISSSLSGQEDRRAHGNRFRHSLLRNLPVPLPAGYICGIDMQKYDFEVGKWSYLCGAQRNGGWYHYYLYALCVKTPVGILVLSALAVVLSVASKRYRLPWRDGIALLLPGLAVLVLVSSQTGFNRYIRYVVPALPFLFVSISRVGLAFEGILLPAEVAGAPVETARRRHWRRHRRGMPIVVVLLLGAGVIESLNVFPHSMSFFNVFVGGPRGGPSHLLDANIDWGQDLLYLKSWIDSHPMARPMHVQYFGLLDPKAIGVDWPAVARGPAISRQQTDVAVIGPQPGWFAVSVNDVYGYRHHGQLHEEYTYFQEFNPIDAAGYSIYIYHVSPADANRVRRELGLPLLEPAHGNFN